MKFLQVRKIITLSLICLFLQANQIVAKVDFDLGKSEDSQSISDYSLLKKKQKILSLLKHYDESASRRFGTLFFIAYPFSLIMVFVSVQLYGLSMAGDSAFQMTRSHFASVVLGSSFLSAAVAYKGYSNYQQRRQNLVRELEGYENLQGNFSYPNSRTFRFDFVLGALSF